ncbi:MAG TPA: CaiB/BaiF CoA-transferase family protein [Rhodocyclaceae bacterium]|nr:CaiB/BaiF CoA-transferase family protein [Rhodocyclaceae bacterium]
MAKSLKTSGSTTDAPLAGLRVLDLTRLLPGPVCTLHLADLGADVIKIEDIGAGDYARSMGVGAGPGEDSYFFRIVNRNKRGLRLDLKRQEGVDVFLRLARDADVIVEGFRPGVVDRLGVGYEAVRAINPRIVYCAITGYGQDGPWRDRAGHDINYVATAGVLDQIGTAGGTPALPNFQIGDLLGGAMTAVAGILAAVIAAKVSGEGRYVDVAMTDAVFAHAYSPLLATLVHGKPLPRGNDLLSGALPGYGIYRTRDDRYMAVGALEPKFWELFCDTLARPDLKSEGFVGGERAARVRDELAAIFSTQPLAFWEEKFSRVDCGVTPVLTFDEAMEHPQLKARGMTVDADGLTQLAPPFRLSGFDFRIRRSAPGLGADSDVILREAGYVESEIARLKAAGII